MHLFFFVMIIKDVPEPIRTACMGLVLLNNITATIYYELVLCCTSYIDSIKFIQPVITNPPPLLYNIERGGGLILLDEFYEVITNS